MRIPKIGEIVTTSYAIELCEEFRYDYLAKRIKANKDDFKELEFDGASMVHDEILSRLHNIPHLTEIALRHDLKYAYGELGNKEEKLRADLEFALEVLNDGASANIIKYRKKAVESEKIQAVLKAGLSASGKSKKPWEFIVVDDSEKLKKLSHAKPGGSETILKEILSAGEDRRVLAVLATGYPDQEKPAYTEEDMDFSKVYYNTYGSFYKG
ncbi:hypothetical protein [uncultured Ilyobacter sp.]|uniref:hypothetical protein n=1 Tax=uncultured Ilyobacter sp. TaxID=544433 RepID=UPI0029F47B4B|nr:hypothetical protein [uncultured Ilyobacter sp.]